MSIINSNGQEGGGGGAPAVADEGVVNGGRVHMQAQAVVSGNTLCLRPRATPSPLSPTLPAMGAPDSCFVLGP